MAPDAQAFRALRRRLGSACVRASELLKGERPARADVADLLDELDALGGLLAEEPAESAGIEARMSAVERRLDSHWSARSRSEHGDGSPSAACAPR